MSTSGEEVQELDALIVGTGFGGCYLLNLLRKSGLKTKVVEAGAAVGGVWNWNRYPGARVDVEFPWYGFSDPDIWGSFVWDERYPTGSELRRYFRHVDKVWDLSKDIDFNTEVVGAKFQDSRWEITTAKGAIYRCKHFISCAGTSFKQHIPEWKGREKFRGVMHHSASWPEEKIDIAGKRIAVIGAGSTAIQVVQEAAKVSAHVTQIIRSPNLALPMNQRKISEEEIYSQKSQFPYLFKSLRENTSGQTVQSTGKQTMETDPKTREAIWEEGWKRGGFNWSMGCFTDTVVSEEANRAAYDFWAKKTRARMTDEKKKDLLAPLEPPYFVGTKRPSLEQDYYECCDRPNVEITNSPITEFTETGITTEEKHTNFDIVVICTGYDAVTGGLRTMGIKGRDGIDLNDKWRNGILTNLGVMVNGFPNMFMVYGPQAPTSLANGPVIIEMQCEWIRDVLERQRKDNLPILETTAEAEKSWANQVANMAAKTLFVRTDSWYMGANIPGKKREYLLYLGGIPAWQKAADEALDGWKGFIKQPSNTGAGKRGFLQRAFKL